MTASHKATLIAENNEMLDLLMAFRQNVRPRADTATRVFVARK
jgi:hypothetical protein